MSFSTLDGSAGGPLLERKRGKGHVSEGSKILTKLGFLAALERCGRTVTEMTLSKRISVSIGLMNELLKRTTHKGYVKAKAANLLFKTRLAGRGLYLRVPSASFRVGFLIAGVPRAGTTSLYYLLHQHTSIGLPVVKEVNFFNNDIAVDWCKPDYNLYHRYFPCKLGKTIFGEATPNYIYWPNALERIKVYNPNMRLIFLFRDPIERTYSAWCQKKRSGKEALPFADVIRSERARITSERGPPNRYFFYVERGFYARHLSRALELFPNANILTLESQRLNLDLSLFMGQISHFLGLGTTNQTFTPIHKNKRSQKARNWSPPSAADVKLLADLFAPELERFSNIVDFSIGHWPTSRILSGSASAEEIAANLAEPGFAERTTSAHCSIILPPAVSCAC